MKKRILTLALVILMCISVLYLPAAAADVVTVSASYSNGVVTVSGTGFTGGTSYTVRVVNTSDSSITAMTQVSATGSGAISAAITTGILSSSRHYAVYINKADGTLAGSDTSVYFFPPSGGGGGGTIPDISKFTDVSPSSWYYDAVKYVTEAGLMIGTSDTSFEPNASMTRAMFATVLYRLANEPSVTGSSGFADVISGSWYDNAVTWGRGNNIMRGIGDNMFSPNAAVTREQMVTFMYRYASFMGLNTSNSSINSFSDSSSVSDWAFDAMGWAMANHLLSGTGNNTLAPLVNATRADVATVLMRFVENLMV